MNEEPTYYFKDSKVSWQGPGIYAFYPQQISWLSQWIRLETIEEISREIIRKPANHVVILHKNMLNEIEILEEQWKG